MTMLVVAALVAPLAAGCGEKTQTAGSPVKKSDAKPWEGPHGGATYAAEGFKAGDKAAWEAQLKARAERGQNEYTRVSAGKP
jgi:hypothetical protein